MLTIDLGLAVLPSPLLVSRPAAGPEKAQLLAQKGAVVERGRCHATTEYAGSVFMCWATLFWEGLSGAEQESASRGQQRIAVLDLRQP